jgi:alpha-glucosidase
VNYWAALIVLGASHFQTEKTTLPSDSISSPPPSLTFDGFYSKCAYLRDIPIISSSKVDDRAFRVLINALNHMLAKVPLSTTDYLVKQGSHYSMIAAVEGQTDLPEYADLRNDPKTDWNKRARGLGGLVTSAAEENILEFPNDPYKGESIYIHEFSHTLANYAFNRSDPTFMPSLRKAYRDAIASGLWKNTYSASNYDEYWAEGVQMYFDCARSASPPNGVHNEVCNRVGLAKYDSELFRLVDKEFGHNPWRYEGTYCTTNRNASVNHGS